MPTVRFEPSGKTVEIDDTTPLREAAYLAGVPLGDRCGGMGACCSCVVTVLEGAEHLSEKNTVEAAVFYLADNDRLSCQCTASGDVVLQSSVATANQLFG